ncbi:KAP family NTPase [Oscillochloris sp. ZM17-4]|uniref:KAP family P-loop NTPase fold protein n=1 Tax=Oscillochloris sp. ZM17-4 TaxID=2866714 RepID=UPI001C72A338|nr:P-loop NTPase fold protein [Oscillochloris sp. ZM17-4]MBX0328390.1 KAP family NTPase [Oscillochloris sp. ZM17-4]
MTNPGYGDLPATTDELGFTPSAAALAAIVQGADLADTPLTVGVYGPWGSGKTSLMHMILDRLDDTRCTPVWFAAWRYAQQEALWRALLLSVVESLRILVTRDDGWLSAYITRQNRLDPRKSQTALDAKGLEQTRTTLTRRLDDLAASLYRSVDREEPGAIEFQWDKAGKLAAGTIIRAGFSYIPVLGGIADAVAKAGEKAGEEDYASQIFDLFQRERTRIYREQVQSLEQFHDGLRDLVKELVTDFGRRLVVFIDDLDRCLPEQAIGVLEAIKVFLDMPGCVFVLGVDREIIERGIRVRYKEFALSASPTAGPFPVAERDYLEKIVQVPFTLPPLAPAAITTFLKSRLPGVDGLSSEDAESVARLMTAGLLRNPRKVKRSFNIFRLHLTLDRAHGRQTPAGLIAKLTVIQSSFADLYERIARDPTLLRQVEQIVRGTPGAGAVSQDLRDEVGKSDPRLKELLYLSPFFGDLGDDALRELVYQSTVTGDGA